MVVVVVVVAVVVVVVVVVVGYHDIWFLLGARRNRWSLGAKWPFGRGGFVGSAAKSTNVCWIAQFVAG